MNYTLLFLVLTLAIHNLCSVIAAPQQWIGHVDVKTRSVHFYVTRSTSFTTANSVIPFQLAHLNEGGAMNLATGYFVAPVSSIYHFEFSGVKPTNPLNLLIFLQHNGANVGYAYTEETGNSGSRESISLTTSLRLIND